MWKCYAKIQFNLQLPGIHSVIGIVVGVARRWGGSLRDSEKSRTWCSPTRDLKTFKVVGKTDIQLFFPSPQPVEAKDI